MLDQKRIFDRVSDNILFDNKILRFYISGEGDTGKNFLFLLIKVIRSWIKRKIGKATTVHSYINWHSSI